MRFDTVVARHTAELRKLKARDEELTPAPAGPPVDDGEVDDEEVDDETDDDVGSDADADDVARALRTLAALHTVGGPN